MGLKLVKSRAWVHVARRRDHWPYTTIAALARSYLGAHEGVGAFQLDEDGEIRVMQAVAADRCETVFDVGANVGEWSLAMAEASPTATIHAFEPVASTNEVLCKALAPYGERAIVNPAGLSDEVGTMAINVPDDGSDQSSLMDTGERTEDIELWIGDEYCATHGVERIDFLKVDTEGWDHRVLGGFQRMLDEGRIGAVQFEYGAWALESRFLLKDFYQRLEECGMVIGKVYPASVAFGPYTAALEDFRGLNFLAVSRDRAELIEALGPNGAGSKGR